MDDFIDTCRVCGCTDMDCSGCIERTGERCYWVEPGLCSACASQEKYAAHIRCEFKDAHGDAQVATFDTELLPGNTYLQARLKAMEAVGNLGFKHIKITKLESTRINPKPGEGCSV